MYEIKKGIPVQGFTKRPFKDMEVGDCFNEPIGSVSSSSAIIRITASIRVYIKTNDGVGKKFLCRTQPEEKVIRVWRII